MLAALAGCPGLDAPSPEAESVALAFARAVVEKKPAAAYELTADEYRRAVRFGAFEEQAQALLPADFGPISRVLVVRSSNMAGWKGWRPGDIGWAYVAIEGAFSQGIAVFVRNENGQPRIRQVEWGRP